MQKCLPPLSVLKKTLKLCEDWAKQDWTFLLQVLDVHETLLKAHGIFSQAKIGIEILVLRLRALETMSDPAFLSTTHLVRVLD